MSSINKVTLLGNVGKEPEIRHTQEGTVIANLTVATSEKWTSKQTGEKQERTEWHRVVVFGKMGQIVEKYVKKGDKIYFEGQICTRKWTGQDGQDRYTTEVQVKPYGGTLVLLGGKREGSSGKPAAQAAEQPKPDEGVPFDDDIPF